MAIKPVFFSLSPYGAGSDYDLKYTTGTLTISISGGVATLSEAQIYNIGVGCDIDYGAGPTHVYIAPNRIPFNSGGTTELKVGDKIEGGTSGATGIVRAIELISGTWAGGDAAGYIYFSTSSGTWQSEQINRTKPSSSSDIASCTGAIQGNIGNGNTQFVVKKPNGDDAANDSGNVNYIYHEYASISAFEAGLTDANHLNATNLTTTGATCYGACYYDHSDYDPDINAFTINNDGQDEDNYIHLFTPIGESESINNQRHPGYWDDNKFKVEISYDYSYIEENYVRIEGIQFKFINASSSYRYLLSSSASYSRVFACIFRANLTSTGGCTLLRVNNLNAHGIKIFNNIIYDSIVGTVASYGLYAKTATDCYYYNNTIYNCRYGIDNGSCNNVFKNNLVNDCTGAAYAGSYSSDSTHNVTNFSVSGGAFGVAADSGNCDGIGSDTFKLRDTGQNFQTTVQVGCIVKNTTDTTYSYVTSIDSDTQLTLNDDIMDDGENYIIYTNMFGSVTFENEGASPPDLHLGSADTVAKGKGTDLSSDANLPIWNDIDGDER